MASINQKRRKIVVDDRVYFWATVGKQGHLLVRIMGDKTGGPLLVCYFRYLDGTPVAASEKRPDGQRPIITPAVVRKIIALGLENGWSPRKRGTDLLLGYVDDKIDLEVVAEDNTVVSSSASRTVNPSSVDYLGAITLLRTGWLTQLRTCPVHEVSLELCFDETNYSRWSSGHQSLFNHDENRIRWRCNACAGTYTENYFLSRQPLEPSPLRLILECPDCESKRVTHVCVPECCSVHTCWDCGAEFELEVSLVAEGSRKVESFDSRGSACLDIAMTTRDPPMLEHRSGWSRDFRKCSEDDTPLELVFISDEPDQPTRIVGWYCSSCGVTYSEGNFRPVRQFFASDANPGAVCTDCGSRLASVKPSREKGEAGGSRARCVECSAEFQLQLVAKTLRWLHF